MKGLNYKRIPKKLGRFSNGKKKSKGRRNRFRLELFFKQMLYNVQFLLSFYN
jgi:hypothetical protein